MKRLKNAHFGQWIDPSKTVQFTFEGELIQGLEGDTVASALLANDQWLQSRSFKYHRPRGPLTLCGYDANTLVQTPITPNLLADRLPAEDHLAVTAQNYTGSLQFDLSRLLDWFGRFLPVGFYYKAFFKPRGIWAWWEPIVRKAAGLGISNLSVKAAYNDKTYAFADVAVIGAGPAGLNAALLAANAGAKVTLVEQEPHLGGSMNYHAFDRDYETTKSARDALVAAVEAHENIDVLSSSTCNAWFGDHYLPIIQKTRLIKLRAKQTILTTGSSEQHVVFRNNDLPGVVMCSALDRLMRLYGVVPSAPVVVLAGNDLAYRTAFSSQDGGANVAAIVDLRNTCDDTALSDEAKRRGIALFKGCGIYEAKHGLFSHGLSQVDVHKLDERGEVAEKLVSIDCGLLAMSAGFMPSYQLACQAGAVLSYDDSTSQFQLSNLPQGMHLAGSVNSVFSLDLVEADGRNAARQALSNLGIAHDSETVVS